MVDLNNLGNARIMVIGDFILDRYIIGEAQKISPEAPIIVINEAHVEDRLGGAANVANNIRGMGGNVVFCSAVGDDENTASCFRLLEKAGIKGRIVVDMNRPVTRKTRVLASHPYHPHQQVVRIDREKTDDVCGDVEKELIGYVKSAINDIDLVIFSDYNKGLITENIAKSVIKMAKDNGKKILVNTKPKKIAMFRGCEWFTCNRNETEGITGLSYNNITDKDGIMNIGSMFMEKVEPEYFVMTCGGEGMILFDKNKRFIHIPTVTKDVADVSGAGDTVVALLGLCIASGLDPEASTRIANIAAGCVVTKLGTATVTREELETALRNNGL